MLACVCFSPSVVTVKPLHSKLHYTPHSKLSTSHSRQQHNYTLHSTNRYTLRHAPPNNTALYSTHVFSLHPPPRGAVRQGGRAAGCVEGRADGERLPDPDGVFQTAGPGSARPLLGPGVSQVSGSGADISGRCAAAAFADNILHFI